MKPQSLNAIKNELGEWSRDNKKANDFFKLIFKKSDHDIDLFIPHPDKQITIFGRPEGFQINAEFGNVVQYFAIPYKDIISVQILPSFYYDENYSNGSFKTISFTFLAFAILYLGSRTVLPALAVLFITYLLFMLPISMQTQTLRQKMLIEYTFENKPAKLILSFRESKHAECEEFFKLYIAEKLKVLA
jgi:hypothetical protein